MWTIIADGTNPPFGTVTVGPFDSYDEAEAFAERDFSRCKWRIVAHYQPHRYRPR